MTQQAKNKLVDISIHRVASVDKAANKRTFAILKRAQEPPAPVDPPTTTPPVDPNPSSKGDPVTKTAENPQKPSLEGLNAEQKAYVGSLEKRADTPQVAVIGEDDDYEAAIMKMDVSDPVKQQLIKSEKRAREADKVAKQERDTRLEREHVAKAQTDYARLGKSADTIGGLLFRIEKSVSADDFKQVQELLKGADAQLKAADIFVVKGEDGDGGEEDAYGELKKVAAEIRKADTTLTQAQAMVKAKEQRPELAKRYQEENRSR